MEINIDKTLLENYYIMTNHSIAQCALFFHVCTSTIKKLLKQYDIHKSKDLVIKCRQNTCIQQYGFTTPAGNPEVVAKMKNTKLQKYGNSGYNNIQQIKLTNLKKYGVENISQSISPEKRVAMRAKALETCVEKYGTEKIWESEVLHDAYIQGVQKRKDTCLAKYGVEAYTQSQIFSDHVSERTRKTQDTNMRKYGVLNVSQIPGIAAKKGSHYHYEHDGETMEFDSSWELALWIFAKNHHECIVKNPCSFTYTYNDVQHTYIPDFLYQGSLIEIKGDQFWEGNKMICPSNRQLDDLFEAKYQCMVANNIIIWGRKEIAFAIDYVKQQYGASYLSQFKK